MPPKSKLANILICSAPGCSFQTSSSHIQDVIQNIISHIKRNEDPVQYSKCKKALVDSCDHLAAAFPKDEEDEKIIRFKKEQGKKKAVTTPPPPSGILAGLTIFPSQQANSRQKNKEKAKEAEEKRKMKEKISRRSKFFFSFFYSMFYSIFIFFSF